MFPKCQDGIDSRDWAGPRPQISVKGPPPSPSWGEEGLRDWILLNWLCALRQGVYTSEPQLSHL